MNWSKNCSRFCARVHHVQTAADLRDEWFCTGNAVGITAGTSTPDSVIVDVEKAIATLARNKAGFSRAISS